MNSNVPVGGARGSAPKNHAPEPAQGEGEVDVTYLAIWRHCAPQDIRPTSVGPRSGWGLGPHDAREGPADRLAKQPLPSAELSRQYGSAGRGIAPFRSCKPHLSGNSRHT